MLLTTTQRTVLGDESWRGERFWRRSLAYTCHTCKFYTRHLLSNLELRLTRRVSYANYAAANQDVTSSYGAENVAKLKYLRTKYDPTGLLHQLVPGGLSGMLPAGGTFKEH
jgi:hypothetical protein